MAWFTGPALLIGLVAVFVVGGLVAAGVLYLEARNRREDEAARLEQALAEPLAHDPALAGVAVRPVAHITLRGSARVELQGWVVSRQIGDAAVRAVRRQAASLGREVRVVNRLDIVDRDGSVRRPV